MGLEPGACHCSCRLLYSRVDSSLLQKDQVLPLCRIPWYRRPSSLALVCRGDEVSLEDVKLLIVVSSPAMLPEVLNLDLYPACECETRNCQSEVD